MWVKYGVKPICFISDIDLLVYRWGRLYRYDLESRKMTKLKVFSFLGILECIFPIVFRFLRRTIRTGLKIDENIVLLQFGKKIYEYNLSLNTISKGFLLGRSRVLKFSIIEDKKIGKNQVVFGEYFGNPKKEEVFIYKRTGVDRWDKIYRFSPGEITHVHNIVSDKYNDCIWVFTGDFGNEAGIWKTDDDFKTLEPILLGSQKYRACIGFPTEDGLLYATDTPFEYNAIRILHKDNEGNWTTNVVKDIKGSCIYGCQCSDDKYVFSSTVESDGIDEGFLSKLFGRKRGKGIIDDNAYIYIGNGRDFNVIYESEKDIWPFIFQFGTFMFPAGKNKSKYLPFYPIAVKKNNMSMIVIEKN